MFRSGRCLVFSSILNTISQTLRSASAKTLGFRPLQLGEEAGSLRAVCEVCAPWRQVLALIRRAAACAKMKPSLFLMPDAAGVECCIFARRRILVGLRWRSEGAVVFLGFPMSLKAPGGASHPGYKGCAIVIAIGGLVLRDFCTCGYCNGVVKGVEVGLAVPMVCPEKAVPGTR